MRIGVEEPVAEDHADVDPHERLDHVGRIEPGGAQPGDIGDLDAVQELHGQHAPGGELAVDLRHDDARGRP